jgi:hypothetical protein
LRDPIFIHGIQKRSGTNYLCELLKLHPDCYSNSTIFEDWYLSSFHHLENFVNESYYRWKDELKWEVEDNYRDNLFYEIGQSLIRFLNNANTNKILVTKTPNVLNIENFFKLFPNAYLIILIRDGRDVAESNLNTWNIPIEFVAKKWAESAKLVLEFNMKYEGNKNFMIIKYEDLILNLENEMVKVLNFLNLNSDNYDMESAKNLRVIGSSTFTGEDGKFKYMVKNKPDDFNSIKRWSNWSNKLHQRFNWLAGEQMIKFGYKLENYQNKNFFWILYNNIMDLLLKLKSSRTTTT